MQTAIEDKVTGEEVTFNQKLKPKRALSQALGVTYTTIGRHYPGLVQNWLEKQYINIFENKGWKYLVIGIGSPVLLLLGAIYYPPAILPFAMAPLWFLVMRFPGKELAKKKKKEVYDLQYAEKSVPVGVNFDEIGMKINTVLLESKITGIHRHIVNEDSITDTPKPGGIQIMGANKARDYVTNKEVLLTEFTSDDGKFAAGNPFTGYGNFALLRSYQDPIYKLAPKYRKLIDHLDKELPKASIEKIDEIKVLNARMDEHVLAMKGISSAIKIKLERMGKTVRKLGELDIQSDRFITNLDVWNEPWYRQLMEYRKTPEVTRFPPLVEQMNDHTSLANLMMTMKYSHTRLFAKARMALYDADVKIQKQSIDQILQTASTDSKKLDSPVPADLQREVIRVNNNIVNDEEDEDEW